MKKKIELNLIGYFPDYYKKHKKKEMTNNQFVTAIVQSWLLDRMK